MVAYDPAPPRQGELPSFPPLLTGEPVKAGIDPFDKAVAAAAAGTAEPGQVFWSPDADTLRAALVLAPETSLARAMAMVFAVACGLNDALGALAPPELAVHHVWPDGIKANGAFCGAIRAASDAAEGEAEPAWLVVGIAVQLRGGEDDPGRSPELTDLAEEGCQLAMIRLLESWARHTLVWIHRWQEDGFGPLHEAWLARAEGRGEEVVFEHGGVLQRGRFVGLDETGDMLLRTAGGMEQLALLAMLDHPRPWPPRHP